MASVIDTIRFVLTDNKGFKHTSQLDNVIYLPESANNLISVSKWPDDKGDDCVIINRGRFSIFLGNQESNRKYIHHPPDFKILLMLVNEGNDEYVLFNMTHHDYYPDNQILIPNGCPSIDDSDISIPQLDTNLD